MANTWPGNVRHVRDGEAVNASVVSRPDRDNESRSAYLRYRQDAAELGENVILYEKTVKSDVLIGSAVYYNSETQQFELALAQAVLDEETGAFVISPSADVIGIVRKKHNSQLADIVALGLSAIDLSATVDDPDTAGRLYLSTQTPGKLTPQRPAVSVPVAYNLGNGQVSVLPTLKDFMEDHIHFRVELVAEPAGDHAPPAEGQRHEITNADEAVPGWLPASDDSFNGLAPAGAAFGYNLAAHPALSRIWPPIPVESAALFWDKGADRVGGTLVPQGLDGLVVMDRNGIWWMSDCYGDVPWPTDFISGESLSESSLGSIECPRTEKMKLVLVYTTMTFATSRSVVTSLKAADGSPLRILNCDGEEADTGALVIDLDLEFLVSNTLVSGATVFKSLDGVTFSRGLVVEKLVAGANITLSSTNPIANNGGHQGTVTINADLDAFARDLHPQITRLGDAVERSDDDIPFIGFRAGRDSAIRMQFSVPSAGLPNTPTAILRLTCLSKSAGTFPELAAAYRRLPRETTATALPTADTSMTIDTEIAVTADSYFDVDSAAFAVAAGDAVYITVERSSLDAFAGEIGIIRGRLIISGS